MKMIHKILLSLAVLSAVAPSNMQANALTRVMTKQNLLAAVKNPGVVMGVAAVASAVLQEWVGRKASEAAARASNKRQAADVRRVAENDSQRYSRYYLMIDKVGAFCALGAANYALYSAANKLGYIGKASQSRKIACMYGIAISLGLAKLSSRAEKNLSTTGQQNQERIATAGKWLNLEAAAALTTYLLWFA